MKMNPIPMQPNQIEANTIAKEIRRTLCGEYSPTVSGLLEALRMPWGFRAAFAQTTPQW
jgi:hypothetical protein